MYSVYLEDWYAVYPREQIKVIKMEEYSQYKAQILQDTVRFLELGKYILISRYYYNITFYVSQFIYLTI